MKTRHINIVQNTANIVSRPIAGCCHLANLMHDFRPITIHRQLSPARGKISQMWQHSATSNLFEVSFIRIIRMHLWFDTIFKWSDCEGAIGAWSRAEGRPRWSHIGRWSGWSICIRSGRRRGPTDGRIDWRPWWCWCGVTSLVMCGVHNSTPNTVIPKYFIYFGTLPVQNKLFTFVRRQPAGIDCGGFVAVVCNRVCLFVWTFVENGLAIDTRFSQENWQWL